MTIKSHGVAAILSSKLSAATDFEETMSLITRDQGELHAHLLDIIPTARLKKFIEGAVILESLFASGHASSGIFFKPWGFDDYADFAQDIELLRVAWDGNLLIYMTGPEEPEFEVRFRVAQPT